PTEPLLCKFADGGQKKRQNQGKYLQNGRSWGRDTDTGGMTLTYDPTALQNGFYSSPYSIAPNRMIAQTSLSPYMSSQVPSYQGTVLTPTLDHTMSIQPTSLMSPLTQQLSHLTLGSAGTYMPANTTMQGSYIPQYTSVPPSSVSVEENSGTHQQVPIEPTADHTNYTYQHSKRPCDGRDDAVMSQKMPTKAVSCKKEAICEHGQEAPSCPVGRSSFKMNCFKWKSVLWSDESKYDIHVGNPGRRVLQAKEEWDFPVCFQRSVQKSASLMVWGAEVHT
ncbi:RNA-binding motif, single-stranded-interacting protein 2 isoform X2, partial [Silurus asotus]